MLSVHNLEAYYGEAQALQGIELAIEEGEIVCLIGNNGAGKSTTLMSISGTLKKKTGSIKFCEDEISSLSAHKIVARGISLVPEGRRIFPTLTVEENIKMGAFLNKKKFKEKITEIYDMFPVLKKYRSKLGGSLSGGEQQMLAIGRALIGEPKLLMLDEPSLGLAPQIIDNIFDAIVSLRKKGLTVFLVEQNADLALDVSDRAYVIELGKIVLSGTSSDIKNNQQVQNVYLGK
jgi:branched-chain amino acid transport system ATP-binding protein